MVVGPSAETGVTNVLKGKCIIVSDLRTVVALRRDVLDMLSRADRLSEEASGVDSDRDRDLVAFHAVAESLAADLTAIAYRIRETLGCDDSAEVGWFPLDSEEAPAGWEPHAFTSIDNDTDNTEQE